MVLRVEDLVAVVDGGKVLAFCSPGKCCKGCAKFRSSVSFLLRKRGAVVIGVFSDV